MKKILVSSALASLLAFSPVLALAETTTASAQVQAMLTQIANLKAQLNTLQTAQSNVKSTLTLIRQLKQGMSGDDVTTLQTILASDPSIYPEGTVTGYFGRLTAEAVKKFQKKHGLESVGSVGPKTLAKLNGEIGNLGLSSDNATSTGQNGEAKGRLCVKVPPGHLIAPGWLKKNNGEKPVVPECQTLPPGIINKIGGGPGTPGTTTPDTAAPVISAIVVAPLGTTTSITWTTNELANTKVWFGTSTPMVMASSTFVANGSLVLSHVVSLTNLSTSTTYYYMLGSSDLTGNSSTTTQASFTTTSGL